MSVQEAFDLMVTGLPDKNRKKDEAAMAILIADLEEHHKEKEGCDIMIQNAKELKYSDYNADNGRSLLNEHATNYGFSDIILSNINGKYDS